jgi:hypothetical protein
VASLFKCKFCGTVTIVGSDKADPTAALRENLNSRTRVIETILKRPANYNYDGISDGGMFHVTKSELVFVPHAFNVNTGYRLVFPYHEISDIRRHNAWLGLMRQLVVITKQGERVAFVMWGRGRVLDCVRQQISQTAWS